MVGELSADVDAIVGYTVAASTMSTHIDSALGAAIAANPVVLGPVFGLVGSQFLAAFTQAHAAHVDAMSRLALTAASMGVAAGAAAASYDARDAATALGLSLINGNLIHDGSTR